MTDMRYIEYKIGDKVKIIKNDSYSCNQIGDIGIISNMESFNDCVYNIQVLVPGREYQRNWHVTTDIILFIDNEGLVSQKENIYEIY